MSLIERYEAAFLVDDHATLLGMMADDVVFSDPLSPGQITSKGALRDYLAQANDVMANVEQKIVSRSIDEASGNIALVWEHTGRNAVTDGTYSFPGCTFINIRNGVVTKHQDFFDPAVLKGEFVKAYKLRKQQKQELGTSKL